MKIRTPQTGLTTAPSRLPSLIKNELEGERYSRVDSSKLNDAIATRPQDSANLLADEASRLRSHAKWRGRASTLTKLPGYALAAGTAAGGIAAGVISFSVISSLGMEFFDGLGALAGVVAGGATGFFVAKGGVMAGLYLAGKTAEADLYAHREFGRQSSTVADLSKRVEQSLAQPEPTSALPQKFPKAPALKSAEASWEKKLEGVEAIADNGRGQLLVAHGERLTALNARRGDLVWQKDFDGPFKGPILRSDNQRAFAVSGHQVVQFDPVTGEQQRSFGSAWSNSKRTPDLDIDAQGTRVFVTNQDKRAAAYDVGKEKPDWSFLGAMRGAHPPAAGPEQTVALATAKRVHLVDAQGDPLWKAVMPESVTQQPLVDRHQNVYVATSSGLKALDNRFGLERWSVEAEGISQPPMQGPDDSIVICDKHGLGAYSLQGEQVWRLPLGAGKAAVDPYGRIQMVGASGKAYVIEPKEGKILHQQDLQVQESAIVDGQLITLGSDGSLSGRPLYQQPSDEGNWGSVPVFPGPI